MGAYNGPAKAGHYRHLRPETSVVSGFSRTVIPVVSGFSRTVIPVMSGLSRTVIPVASGFSRTRDHAGTP